MRTVRTSGGRRHQRLPKTGSRPAPGWRDV